MPNTIALIPLVDDLINTCLDGGAPEAVRLINLLPKTQAMVVSAYVVARMPNEFSRSKFLLSLERHASL